MFIAQIPSTQVLLICTHRCGHTSMADYLGFYPLYNYPLTLDMITFNQASLENYRKIVVMRNHYQRIMSAYKFTYGNIQMFHNVYMGKPMIDVSPNHFFDVHKKPYLTGITTEFEYIDFDKLADYIPMSKQTTSTFSNYRKVTPKHLSEIGYTVTDEDRQEQERYNYFKQFHRELPPDEWKTLVAERVAEIDAIRKNKLFPAPRPVVKTRSDMKSSKDVGLGSIWHGLKKS